MYTLLASLPIILATTTDPVVDVPADHMCSEVRQELWAAVERGDIHERIAADVYLRCWMNHS